MIGRRLRFARSSFATVFFGGTRWASLFGRFTSYRTIHGSTITTLIARGNLAIAWALARRFRRVIRRLDVSIFGVETKVRGAAWVHNQTGFSMLSSGINGALSSRTAILESSLLEQWTTEPAIGCCEPISASQNVTTTWTLLTADLATFTTIAVRILLTFVRGCSNH